MTTASDPPKLSKPDVIHLVGDIDDATVTAIIHTNATYVDVEHAVRWMTGAAGDRTERYPLEGSALSVYDILAATPAFAPERER